MRVCVLSCFSRVGLFATLWTVARQAPMSMGFSRQEYWSGLPYHSPEDLPNPGTEPCLISLALVGRFFTTSTTWKPRYSSLVLPYLALLHFSSQSLSLFDMILYVFFFFTFYFGVQPTNNVVIVLGGQQRDSGGDIYSYIHTYIYIYIYTHIHVSTLP